MLGPVRNEAVGSYSYSKNTKPGYQIPCQVFVYPLVVTEHRLAWREQSQRSFKWFSLSDAAAHVDDDSLSQLLGNLAATDGACLHDFIAQSMAALATGAGAQT